MRQLLLTVVFLMNLAPVTGQSKYQNDFRYYTQTINDNFAYFARQHCDWSKVTDIYGPALDTVRTDAGFIHFLEAVNNELHNGHVFLNTNTRSSNRTIPSGADMKVSRINNQFIITELREGFNAAACGLKTGMRITHVNGAAVEQGIQKFLPQSVAERNDLMYTYAANMLLAGTHDIPRILTVISNGDTLEFKPDSLLNKTETQPSALLESKMLPGNIGYLKINNALGNTGLIPLFDDALDSLIGTDGLVLDLRETPGGGNTTVARAVMGRFAGKELPYQKHIYTAEEKETGIRRTTLELVSPRGRIYTKPLVVLVGYWTGSMGEGIAIGFDGMHRAKIAGTAMAGLLGEIYSFETPEHKIPFSFPCVQLQHISGSPREAFVPPFPIKAGADAIAAAVMLLRQPK